MDAKMLIEENNKKRELLTPENESYYSDLMIYIRLQLTLSEQQTEEILIELLDHLLEGQGEGKTARQIFGNDPQGYADEIIEQLPQEDRRSILQFIGAITLNLIGLLLIVRSVVLLIGSLFTEVDPEVTIIKTGIVTISIFALVVIGSWFIMRQIKKSLFTNKSIWTTIKVGFFGAASFTCFLLIVKYVPSIGPSFEIPWAVSLVAGVIIWGIYRKMKTW